MMRLPSRTTASSFIAFLVGANHRFGSCCNSNHAVLAFAPTVNRIRTPLALSMSSMVSKVLQNPKWPPTWPYSEQDFKRMDESEDEIFYQEPRLVYHIDEPCRNALTKYYSEVFQPNVDVLDLCSSWVSHYPLNWKQGKVVGLGMNENELKQNSWFSDYIVKDLNKDPEIPCEPNSFDLVTCCVSIDYLNRPLAVMTEVARVLRPGGQAIIAISNRCFPTKAFQIWLQTNDMEHIFIVGSFFHYTGLFEPPTCEDRSPNPGKSDPLYIIRAVRSGQAAT
jgi:SAM-dependent methyltransferase